VTFVGTLADINNALDGLSLTPTGDTAGSSYIVVAVNDLGNSGAGGPKIAANYVLLTMTEVNEPPIRLTGSLNGLTVSGNSGLTSLGLGAVTYAPGDGLDEQNQTLTYTVTMVPASVGTVFLADG